MQVRGDVDTGRVARTAWRGVLVGLAGALVLGAAACGGDEPAEEPPPPEPVEEPEPEPEPDPEPVEEPEEAIDEPVETGEAELLWRAELEDPVEVVAADPDGVHLAVGARATFTYQLADGRGIDTLVRRHSPEDLAYAPDGSILAIGLGAYGVSLTEVPDGDELVEIGDGFNSRASFAPDGSHLATGERSGSVTLWSPDGSEELAVLVADDLPDGPMNASVLSLEHHPDGVLLAVTQWDDCLTRIWDTSTEQVVHSLDLSANCPLQPTPFAFSPDGDTMVGPDLEDGERVLRWWSVEGVAPGEHLDYPDEIADVAFSPGGELLAVAGRPGARVHGRVHVFDIATGGLVALLEPEPLADDDFVVLNSVVITPDGGHVALGRQDGIVEVWRLPGALELVAPEAEPCEPLPIPSDVLFDTGSAALKAEADAVLTELAEALAAGHPSAELTFIGHTDSRGDAASNQQLSEERGSAVAGWFEEWAQANGVDGWSLAMEGRGDTEPAVQDVDEDGVFLPAAGAMNRRVEITIDADGCPL